MSTRERIWIELVTEVVKRNWLRWQGHVLRKDDDNWMKKRLCEVEGVKGRRKLRVTWNRVVEKDMRACWLNKVDAQDRVAC